MSNLTKICPKCGIERTIKEFRYIRWINTKRPGKTNFYYQCHTCYTRKRDKKIKDEIQKRNVKKLTDSYIANQCFKMKLSEVPPELIELKRIQLMILREVKK